MLNCVIGNLYKNNLGENAVLFNNDFTIQEIRVDRQYFVVGPRGEIIQGYLRRRYSFSTTIYMEIPIIDDEGNHMLTRATIMCDSARIRTLFEEYFKGMGLYLLPTVWNNDDNDAVFHGQYVEFVEYVPKEDIKSRDDAHKIFMTDYGDYALVDYDISKKLRSLKIGTTSDALMCNQRIIGKIVDPQCTALIPDEHLRMEHLRYNRNYVALDVHGNYIDGVLIPGPLGSPLFQADSGTCNIFISENLVGLKPTVWDAIGVEDPSNVK